MNQLKVTVSTSWGWRGPNSQSDGLVSGVSMLCILWILWVWVRHGRPAMCRPWETAASVWRNRARSYCEGDAIRIRPSQIFDPFKQFHRLSFCSFENYILIRILLSCGRDGGLRIQYATNVCLRWRQSMKTGQSNISMPGDYFKTFPRDRIRVSFETLGNALMPVRPPSKFQVSNKPGPLSHFQRILTRTRTRLLFESNWPVIKPDSACFLIVFDLTELRQLDNEKIYIGCGSILRVTKMKRKAKEKMLLKFQF